MDSSEYSKMARKDSIDSSASDSEGPQDSKFEKEKMSLKAVLFCYIILQETYIDNLFVSKNIEKVIGSYRYSWSFCERPRSLYI